MPPAAAAGAEAAEQPPAPRVGRLRRVVGEHLQFRRADAQRGVAEMEEAELEAALVAAVGAQFGRHGEGDGARPLTQLGRGEIAPGELEAAQHQDFDPKRRLCREARVPGTAGEMQAVRAGLQMPVRPVKKTAGRGLARHQRGAVRPPGRDRAALQPRQQLPAPHGIIPIAGRRFGDRRGVDGHGHRDTWLGRRRPSP
jgi:hypothetical protein